MEAGEIDTTTVQDTARGLLFLLRRFILASRKRKGLSSFDLAEQRVFIGVHDRLAEAAGEADFVDWACEVIGIDPEDLDEDEGEDADG